jgi:pyrroline-5-carboxylate reductase
MNLAIIGCGIIGRHLLESILNSNINDLNIFAVDISAECLDECKKIAKNKNTFKVYYLSSVKETNKNFDFVIIANNSTC